MDVVQIRFLGEYSSAVVPSSIMYLHLCCTIELLYLANTMIAILKCNDTRMRYLNTTILRQGGSDTMIPECDDTQMLRNDSSNNWGII